MIIEERIRELNEIAEKLESKGVTLEESINLFNTAIKKCAECVAELDKCDGQIRELSAELDKITARPFEEE